MKRWLVIALVALAVLILVTPGIVGRLAEKNLEENLQWAEAESGAIEIRTESFDRGWFTSEGRHRISLSSSAFSEAAENHRRETGYDDLPSLIIDTRLDHGPMPVGTLTRDSGSLAPGLASTVSTFQVDPGNGEPVELPGKLYSNVSLAGVTDSRLLVESGQFANADGSVDWTGADIAIRTDPSAGALSVNGTVEPLTIDADGETVRIGAIDVETDQVMGDYGFNEGSVSIGFESFAVDSPGTPVSIGPIAFSAVAGVTDARLDVESKMSIDDMVVPIVGELSLAMDLALNGLDAASMQAITRAIEDAQDSPDPDAAMGMLYPKIEGDLQNLAISGGELRIDQLDLTLPQGKLTTNLLVEIPEGDASATFAWSSVLLAMTASADIRIPVAIYELIVSMNPQANALLAMGILQRDGEDYVMNAEYAQGLLNVNGAPMPIPMPGM